jgi:hypothetical protein
MLEVHRLTLAKQWEFTKASRHIDTVQDVEELKKLCKMFVFAKIYHEQTVAKVMQNEW